MMLQVKEEEEYLEWLKGQKETLSKKDKNIAAELVGFVVHHCSFYLLTSSVLFSRLCLQKWDDL